MADYVVHSEYLRCIRVVWGNVQEETERIVNLDHPRHR